MKQAMKHRMAKVLDRDNMGKRRPQLTSVTP